MTRTVSVVIPAYRPDVDALASLVRELHEALSPEVVRIELDDPEPGTEEALAALPAAVEVAEDRRGKGAAITDGFDALSTDVLAFVDADGSVPAGSLADVVEPVVAGEAALALGSRRHPDADVQSHQTLARRWLGDAFAALARRLLDVRLYDYQCGAKAIDRETWGAVRPHLREVGFAWDVELVAVTAALGGRVVEVPVTWIDRPESTVDPLATVLDLGRALLSVRRRTAGLRDQRRTDAAADRPDDHPPADRRPSDHD